MEYKKMYKIVKKESSQQIKFLIGHMKFLREENRILRRKCSELRMQVDEPEKLFNPFTENVVEIAWEYVTLTEKYPKLTDVDSKTWKRLFTEWGMEFEIRYPDEGFWDDHDYLDYIVKFARKKILKYAGISENEAKIS